jgi:hypothetical protein
MSVSPSPSQVNVAKTDTTSATGVATTGLVPTNSMYAAGAAPAASPTTSAANVYRYRNGAMALRGDVDDMLTTSNGSFVNKAAANPQPFGKPACGKVGEGSHSSCGSITSLIAKISDAEITGMSPSDRNKGTMFSTVAIARLARGKEQKDQAEAVKVSTAQAEATKAPVSMGAVVKGLSDKAAAESKSIVTSEEQHRDVLNRPCPSGTYQSKTDAALKPMLSHSIQSGTTPEQIWTLAPTPVFASLRPQTPGQITTPILAAGGAPASAFTPNMTRADEIVAAQVAANPALMAPTPSMAATTAATTPAAAPESGGISAMVLGYHLNAWQIALVALAGLVAVLFIAGLVYWLVKMYRGKSGEEKPQGRVMKTVAAAGNVFQRAAAAVADTAKGVFGAGKKAVESAVGAGADIASKTVEGGAALTRGAIDTAAAAATGTLTAAGQLAQLQPGEAVKELTGGLSKAASTAVETVKGGVADVADVAKTAVTGAVDIAGHGVTAAKEAVGGAVNLASETAKATGTVATTAAGLEGSEGSSEGSSESTESSEESSVGTNDINAAFENAEKTENLTDATQRLSKATEQVMKEGEESSSGADVAKQVEAVKSALQDQK